MSQAYLNFSLHHGHCLYLSCDLEFKPVFYVSLHSKIENEMEKKKQYALLVTRDRSHAFYL